MADWIRAEAFKDVLREILGRIKEQASKTGFRHHDFAIRVVEGFQDEKTTLHNRIVASQPEFVRVNRVTGRRKTEATI